MLAVGCGAGVNGWRGAETRRGGHSTAFVENAWRLPDCAVADAQGAFERQRGSGVRLGSSSDGAGYGGALGVAVLPVSSESAGSGAPKGSV